MSLVFSTSEFLLSRIPEKFPGWTLEAMEDYVSHHMRQGTISVGVDEDDEICGVIIGWQQMGSTEQKWEWQDTDPNGDYWFWHQFVADSDDAAIGLIKDIMSRNPAAALLPGSGVRNGELRTYAPGKAMKILQKAKSIYGKHS